MKNKYLSQLQMLQSVNSQGHPLVSLFVPMANSFAGPAEDFRRLVAHANKLLKSEGHPKLDLEMPDWKTWAKQGTKTLAIYHRKGFTTVIPLVIDMSSRVVVASTFHVKPLIASSHSHLEGLHLHFHTQGCSLYRVTPTQCYHLETFLPAGELPDPDWINSTPTDDLLDFFSYVRYEVKAAKNPSVQWLTLSGLEDPAMGYRNFWRGTNLKVDLLGDSSKKLIPHTALEELQKMIVRQTDSNFRQIVGRLTTIANGNPETNVTAVGTKILDRKVSQICVSLEDTHFGEVSADGQVKLHSGQRGVRDDDVLDDLVELALQNGVSVRVVPRKYLPTGQVMIAA